MCVDDVELVRKVTLKGDRSIVEGVENGFPVGEEEGVKSRVFRSRCWWKGGG